MGRKLVRDFVPGMRLSGEGPINGRVYIEEDADKCIRLGAEKVVEEAKELLEAIAILQAPRNIHAIGAQQTRAEQFQDVQRELGDVYAALMYMTRGLNVNVEQAAAAKEKTHGGFTKSFVWEWDGQPRTDPRLDTPVAALELSVRGRKIMARRGLKTLGDLVEYTSDDLRGIPNCGATTVAEIEERLTICGLQLKEGPRRCI